MNSISDIWKLILDRLKSELSETAVNTWFDDEVQPIAIQDVTFYLSCPSDFKRDMIEKLFTPNLKAALKDIFSSDFELKLLNAAETAAFGKDEPKKAASLFESGEFTFDTFVVGDCNNIAYAASRAVADGVIEHYNPLFIYGDSGLGKTHLIYAIAHEIRSKNPDAKIVYIKGDDFTNELVEAIRMGKNVEFRSKYRDADLLLMDDVQFIAGRKQTQEEFFHTFNTLYESKRSIVLTSDRPPREMDLLEDRLRSRFEWGMLADVQPPDFETRLAIVKNKAAQWGSALDDKTAKYIAEKVTANVRQLEGTMNKILAIRDLLGKDLTEEDMERAIRDIVEKNAAPKASSIIAEVSRYFGVKEEDIRGKARTKEISGARQAAIYLVRTLTPISTTDIGREFGGRDHATVLYSIEQVEARIKAEPDFEQKIKDIKININSNR
ncbi:MAG: chromosomal replication initiator protein DnaA [Oscillospiraceae bacterium]|nr:chromosomal replication initiator protein DnaA [Oscillospiraceae bacterium]MBQ5738926.1 chromosomal replication initiator protein DnaA [Oscillospiraceae bacterium]